jgi:CRP/FNR family transcriptional regulator, cyclic AMP receptor protein
VITAAQLRPIAALDRLGDRELEVVARTARPTAFAAQERVFTEGQPASGCWLITSGHIALQVAVPGRGDLVVQTLGPGDLLGWSWLVPPFRWHFAATATDAVAAYEFDTDRLRAAAGADPGLGYHLTLGLVEQLVARLQNTRARLLDLYAGPHDR